MTNLSLKGSLFGVMAVIGLAATAISAFPTQASREKILPTSSPAQQRAIITQNLDYHRVHVHNRTGRTIIVTIKYIPVGYVHTATNFIEKTFTFVPGEDAYLADTRNGWVTYRARTKYTPNIEWPEQGTHLDPNGYNKNIYTFTAE